MTPSADAEARLQSVRCLESRQAAIQTKLERLPFVELPQHDRLLFKKTDKLLNPGNRTPAEMMLNLLDFLMDLFLLNTNLPQKSLQQLMPVEQLLPHLEPFIGQADSPVFLVLHISRFP